jgi:hypothetical protein
MISPISRVAINTDHEDALQAKRGLHGLARLEERNPKTIAR